MIISTPFHGTEVNCEEATAEFCERMASRIPEVTICTANPYWGDALEPNGFDVDPRSIWGDDRDVHFQNEQFSEEFLSTWKQVALEIQSEFGGQDHA